MKKSIICILSLTLAAALLLGSCGFNGKNEGKNDPAEGPAAEAGDPYYDLPDNPVNFSEWQSVNEEIYAYINVPGTNIDYPVLQSGKSDNYYLNRSYKDSRSYRGAIFTQSHNNRDFSDPVTVIYGHNTDKGDMFSELLYFQDPSFFESHDTFTICQPYRIMTYKIISAHTYDDRHILNSFDFSDANVLQSFHDYVLSPETLVKNVRKDASLNLDDRLVILSTCAEAHSGGIVRYLVNGVLIKDEPTK